MEWLNDLPSGQLATILISIFLSGWIAAISMFGFLWRALGKGKLRTEREVEEIRKDRDSAVEKSDTWRQAWQERERAFNMLIQQNAKLLKLSEVGAHVLESLPRPEGGDS